MSLDRVTERREYDVFRSRSLATVQFVFEVNNQTTAGYTSSTSPLATSSSTTQ